MKSLMPGSLFSYVVWVKRGYQDVQQPYGSSIIKVKGIARASTDNSNFAASKFFSVRTRKRMIVVFIHTFR